MLRLQHIQAFQFKNHFSTQQGFAKKVVGICGPNGAGKTNLLDAIYYLCFTKSYFTHADGPLVHTGTAGFRLSGRFAYPATEATVTCILRENGKKECSWNDELYSRNSLHVGRLPAVMIAPDDVELIIGGSETRRRLVDGLLCQLDAQYLQQLMEHNKLLQQRNSQLKQMAEAGRRADALLEVLTEQLAERATLLAHRRHQLLKVFLPAATNHYKLIAGPHEQVQLSYQAAVPDGTTASQLVAHWQQQLGKDLALQRTSSGIHRDDLALQLDGQAFKQIASQGQRKSLLFALKLTEYEWLQQHKGFAPLLLLDDVFEKLDHQRMHNLLREVCVEKPGQVFITDTHRDRLERQLTAIAADYEILELQG
ncbi:MAG: DNA replication and repair protein RecF [Chitinophagaceae bacterium]|jgi:DNA replication and repair protein RecF|nr:DNA replication and repair protein RecF [Chitinophagaceae bacterium]